MTNVWGIIVAAGRGERSGLSYNKALYPLKGAPVLARTMDAMEKSGCFDGLVIVVSSADEKAVGALIAGRMMPERIVRIARGGDSRQDSVMNGILAVPEDTKIVAIHDAARPFATPELIRQTVESAMRFGSGVAAISLKDTIAFVDEDGCAVDTPDRAKLRAVQTPQVFRRSELLNAHMRAKAEGLTATDDAALMQKYFGRVRLIETADSQKNIKLTTREDFQAMETAGQTRTRVGYGTDTHRLTEGRKLILCGVEIPHEKGLLGHSDADVAVHALMDALLGAAALGDIGRHFPDTDGAYKGISSMLLLKKVALLLDEKGFSVENVDVTITAQRPKLSPHMAQMRSGLAETLAIHEGDVNVKATTSEHLGYEGREEGISAAAVAMIAERRK